MIYEIQHRIETLAHNAVLDENQAPSFALLDICFSHWDFNYRDGWSQNYWLANCRIEASNYNEAYQIFRAKLAEIIPRVALIGQCYIESVFEPFLILRSDSDTAFFRYTRDRRGTGLMFMERELRALVFLLQYPEIPEEFYYYWNDAVNSVGYSSKLLIMFAALDTLVKTREGKHTREKDWEKLEHILGPELKIELYGTKKDPSDGLRHRLAHGEYFNTDDSTKDYLERVHKKIINYFNDSIFKERLIEENVVHPQRHLFGNKEQCAFFIRTRGTKS